MGGLKPILISRTGPNFLEKQSATAFNFVFSDENKTGVEKFKQK
jgi:hypothetical protein